MTDVSDDRLAERLRKAARVHPCCTDVLDEAAAAQSRWDAYIEQQKRVVAGLTAEVERLRAERDEWVREWDADMLRRCEAAEAEVERLRAEAWDNRQLSGALLAAEARLDAVRALCDDEDALGPAYYSVRVDRLVKRVRAALGDTPGEAQ